jgi:hypothetical protein
MTAREERIAEETVSAIDFMSRMIGAIEDGRWSYASDKLAQLARTLETLSKQLDRKDQTADGGPVAAAIRRESRHYRIGKALYGGQAADPLSPLQQVEALLRRDVQGAAGDLQ